MDATPVSLQPNGASKTRSSSLSRYTIHDLIQQECCAASMTYPVDKPSSLVRVECQKQGCRCVLKNEPALAFKIVAGVTIVQARWISSRQRHPVSLSLTRSTTDQDNNNNPDSVIFTSCCPSWFELLNCQQSSPTVPIWRDCNAVCQAHAPFILLRKDTACLYSIDPVLHGSLAEIPSSDRQSVSICLDPSNVATLPEGTVLRVIGPRFCRLIVSLDRPPGMRSSSRAKPIAMLQCSVVGSRALSDIASTLGTSSTRFAFQWLSAGPRLIYLPIEANSMLSSPVVVPGPSNRSKKSRLHPTSSSGLYNVLNLLSHQRLPFFVRPVSGFRLPDWSSPQNGTKGQRLLDPTHDDLLLKFETCHHGDLVFLEPISDCDNSTNPGRFFVVTPDMLSQHNFLLADEAYNAMHRKQLDCHAHRVAHFLTSFHPAEGLTYLIKHLEDVTIVSNTGPSHRPVSRTLGPVSVGIDYTALQSVLATIVASATLASGDLSDDLTIENNSDTGLSRSGYSSSAVNLGTRESMSSLNVNTKLHHASSGLLSNGLTAYPSSNLSSSLLTSEADRMNALCDELDDIYFYVRNGRLPQVYQQSQSMTSLLHHHVPQKVQNPPQAPPPLSPQAGRQSSRQYLFPGQSAITRGLSDDRLLSRKLPHPPQLEAPPMMATSSHHQPSNMPRLNDNCQDGIYDFGTQNNGKNKPLKTKQRINLFTRLLTSTTPHGRPQTSKPWYTNTRVLNIRAPPTSTGCTQLQSAVSSNSRVTQLVTCFDACRVTSSQVQHQAPPAAAYVTSKQPQPRMGTTYRAQPPNHMTQSATNLDTAPMDRKSAVTDPSRFASSSSSMMHILDSTDESSSFSVRRHLKPPKSRADLSVPPLNYSLQYMTTSHSSTVAPPHQLRKASNNSSPDTGIVVDSVDFQGGGALPKTLTPGPIIMCPYAERSGYF